MVNLDLNKKIIISIVAITVLSIIVAAYLIPQENSTSSNPNPSAIPSPTALHTSPIPTPTSTSPTSSPTPSSSPIPTPTSSPTSSPSPSATPTPSSTPQPTDTPTPTPTISPTPTPSPTPIPSPSPSPTPTSSPTPSNHTVDYSTLMNQQNENDYWNTSATSSYTIVLNDSMTVTDGDQYLQVVGLTNDTSNTWEVMYQNSTYFEYVTWDNQGNQIDSGWLNCDSGIVQITVTDTDITFTGTSSFTSLAPFVDLGQIWTANADGSFNSGELNINLNIN